MTDEELADEIIRRLNKLIEHPHVREDIEKLIEARIGPCRDATAAHPTIQTVGLTFGFLGLLNGIVGAMPPGLHEGWGYILAVFDDDMKLVSFKRTPSGSAPNA